VEATARRRCSRRRGPRLEGGKPGAHLPRLHGFPRGKPPRELSSCRFPSGLSSRAGNSSTPRREPAGAPTCRNPGCTVVRQRGVVQRELEGTATVAPRATGTVAPPAPVAPRPKGGDQAVGAVRERPQRGEGQGQADEGGRRSVVRPAADTVESPDSAHEHRGRRGSSRAARRGST
jgi:hypothetical protein